jgi:predicted Zn-dependent protease
MSERFRYGALKALAWTALIVGRRGAAMRAFDRMLREFPGDAYATASRAHLHAEAGDASRAIALYRGLVAAHPSHHVGWFNLGFLLEQQGGLDEAREAFERATALNPKLDRAWYGLGLVLIRLQRLDEAVAALKRNTELQPMSPYGWYQLARVQIDRHRPEEAVKIIRHLKGFEPNVAAQLERETGLLVEPAAP